MSDFEELFRLVDEHGGSIEMSYGALPKEDGFPDTVLRLRLRADLGYTARGRKRDRVEIDRLIPRHPSALARGGVYHLRDCVREVRAKLLDMLASPGEIADRLTGGQ